MAAIAILDDYQNVSLRMADWSRLQQASRIHVFTERLPDTESAARALAEFDVIGIMRERTPFNRALFEKLPNLKLLVTTGKRNASIDLEAAKARGVTVRQHRRLGQGHRRAGLRARRLGLARHLRDEFNTMRPGGGWQDHLLLPSSYAADHPGSRSNRAKVARIGTAFDMKLIAWSGIMPEKARERGAERVEDELSQRRHRHYPTGAVAAHARDRGHTRVRLHASRRRRHQHLAPAHRRCSVLRPSRRAHRRLRRRHLRRGRRRRPPAVLEAARAAHPAPGLRHRGNLTATSSAHGGGERIEAWLARQADQDFQLNKAPQGDR